MNPPVLPINFNKLEYFIHGNADKTYSDERDLQFVFNDAGTIIGAGIKGSFYGLNTRWKWVDGKWLFKKSGGNLNKVVELFAVKYRLPGNNMYREVHLVFGDANRIEEGLDSFLIFNLKFAPDVYTFDGSNWNKMPPLKLSSDPPPRPAGWRPRNLNRVPPPRPDGWSPPNKPLSTASPEVLAPANSAKPANAPPEEVLAPAKPANAPPEVSRVVLAQAAYNAVMTAGVTGGKRRTRKYRHQRAKHRRPSTLKRSRR